MCYTSQLSDLRVVGYSPYLHRKYIDYWNKFRTICTQRVLIYVKRLECHSALYGTATKFASKNLSSSLCLPDCSIYDLEGEKFKEAWRASKDTRKSLQNH
ncbi:hypothetical protein F2Q68_00030505 [Brassica cretica]|uniref:Uncharacterized protein n=2 Tax=Brassica cretica TaxID=69181 RepID=A0A8S9GL47_BRACR|nr:hypothetical protein F2Q68_00030505 [Brassica cretica]KAF3532943.1 hypothetical protein DY000_02038940 [Brassica cretica]